MLAAPVQAPAPPLAEGVWRIGAEPLRWEAGRGFAGAISSIRFRGREFLDASDHGRELQGAVQFGWGECLNPTLAGASRDAPEESSSQLLSIRAGPIRYGASTRMAFWNRPGSGCTQAPGVRGLTLNRDEVSALVYTQDMAPGYRGHANAILAQIGIETPRALPPASVEALTGYMPPDFDTFIRYDPQNSRFRPDPALNLRSAEGEAPLILSTADGRSAMGVIGLPGATQPRYAGFHSKAVGKWSVVYHETAPFTPGVHRYACVWIIGTRREVEDSLAAIVAQSAADATSSEATWAGAAAAALLLGMGLLVAWERRRRSRPLSRL
ncbi:hypothetical protein [Caulobacter sp. S45]|uniref:hypothetical protein n=1 Tax=Caulobacter sp. S45 TaxID=1641861 RepID=UPI001576975D|nr:hypothetical protein [Caulobacter sp. S45]